MPALTRRIKLATVTVALALASVGLFAPPANACMLEVCGNVNHVCQKMWSMDCLG